MGPTSVTTDDGGNASFLVSFPIPVPIGQVVTATATNAGNNTSEFSQCATVVAPL